MSLLRRAYDALESAAAPHLDTLVESEGLIAAANAALKARRVIGSGIAQVEAGLLHLANLPTATDIRHLRRQIGALDHEVRRLRLATTGADRATRITKEEAPDEQRTH